MIFKTETNADRFKEKKLSKTDCLKIPDPNFLCQSEVFIFYFIFIFFLYFIP